MGRKRLRRKQSRQRKRRSVLKKLRLRGRRCSKPRSKTTNKRSLLLAVEMTPGRRGRRLSSDGRHSRRVSTPKLLLASTHPRSGCTPSTRGEPTPGPTTTGRSCTKVAGRSSGQRPLTLSGKRSTTNGPRGLPRSLPSGSERGPARRLENLNLPKETRKEVRRHLQRKRRRKRKKRRSKLVPHTTSVYADIPILVPKQFQ